MGESYSNDLAWLPVRGWQVEREARVSSFLILIETTGAT